MLVSPYQQELLKIVNSIQTINKHETSFLGIVKFILIQRNRSEYQLNLLEAALQKLRERDFNTSSRLFQKQEVVIALVRDCPNLQTLGLILKQHHLFLDKDTYDFGTPILETVYAQVKGIASRAQQYDCFMVVPIDDFGRTKKSDPSKYWNKITQEAKYAYQARIYIMIEFVIFPLVEYYSTANPAVLDDLRIVIKWLFFISDYGEPQKLILITQLARKILPKICSPMSTANPNLLYCFNVMMRVLALPLYQKQIIKPLTNLGLFLLDFPQIVIDKLVISWFKTIKPGDLPKQGFLNIVNNLLDCMTQFQSLKIILFLSKELERSQNTEALAYIYELVIKRKMVQKLYMAPNSWKLAIDVLLYYIVGFVNCDRIGQELETLTFNYTDLLEQSHLQQLVQPSTDMVSYSLNTICFKNTSVKPLIFLLELCQYRFKSLTHKTQQLFNQLKFKYQIEIDFYDIENFIKNNMFEKSTNFGSRESISDHQMLIPTKRYKGLENIGNTCYMNSFLQVLFMTKRFNDIISQIGNPANKEQAKKPCFILHELFEELKVKAGEGQGQKGGMDPIVPYKFKKFLMEPFATSKDQQDSAEFGRLYLEHILIDFSKDPFFSEQLERLFFNRTISQISCTRCQSRSNRQQKILDYILPFPPAHPTSLTTPSSISSLFKSYFTVQHLDQHNTMFCSKCQAQQQISTKIYPKQFSTIITLTLNRFLYNRVQQKKVKLLNPVSLELEIDIHDITPMAQSCKYTLQAFIVHIGVSAEAGHYVAYSRNVEENPNLWYVFDDGFVTEKEVKDVKEFGLGEFETPYVLFYNSEQAMMESMRLRESQASIMSSRISNR